jgi:hypothetical protein
MIRMNKFDRDGSEGGGRKCEIPEVGVAKRNWFPD